MAEYKIVWVIEVDANSSVEAAMLAKIIQLDPNSEANHFIVYNKETNETKDIELQRMPDEVPPGTTMH